MAVVVEYSQKPSSLKVAGTRLLGHGPDSGNTSVDGAVLNTSAPHAKFSLFLHEGGKPNPTYCVNFHVGGLGSSTATIFFDASQ